MVDKRRGQVAVEIVRRKWPNEWLEIHAAVLANVKANPEPYSERGGELELSIAQDYLERLNREDIGKLDTAALGLKERVIEEAPPQPPEPIQLDEFGKREVQARAIKHTLASGCRPAEVARMFNVSPSLVCMIRSGKRWGKLEPRLETQGRDPGPTATMSK